MRVVTKSNGYVFIAAAAGEFRCSICDREATWYGRDETGCAYVRCDSHARGCSETPIHYPR